MLWHCNAKYDSAWRVIQWAVAQKAFHTILRNPNGNRNVLYLYRNDDGEWNWNYNWLDNDWNTGSLSAGRAIIFISLPAICSESFVLEVLKAVRSSRRAFCQPRLFFPKVEYIYYYLKIWFPKVSSRIFLKCRFF